MQLVLGKTTTYTATYSPNLLFAVPRELNRNKIGITSPVNFFGSDVWNAYEISWLNAKGKPQIAVAQFIFDCTSPSIVESKSFKLYLNSFNNTQLASTDELVSRLTHDLSNTCGNEVKVYLRLPEQFNGLELTTLEGICLDTLDITCGVYKNDASLLTAKDAVVAETLYSNLLKANCMVTAQPDWGSVRVSYVGPKIDQENLLRYIVSFRDDNEFAETSVEHIFNDVLRRCKPHELIVEAFYTRRGGLDINPIRSTKPLANHNTNIRLFRH